MVNGKQSSKCLVELALTIVIFNKCEWNIFCLFFFHLVLFGLIVGS